MKGKTTMSKFTKLEGKAFKAVKAKNDKLDAFKERIKAVLDDAKEEHSKLHDDFWSEIKKHVKDYDEDTCYQIDTEYESGGFYVVKEKEESEGKSELPDGLKEALMKAVA